MTKYLKHINPFAANYSSGRTDVLTISATPGTVLLYSDIVNEDNTSKDYNAHLWDDYVSKGHWTIISINDITWNDFAVSFNVGSGSAFIFNGGGSANWPIGGLAGNFTFTQGSFIVDGIGFDNFTITQTGSAITNGSLPLNILPGSPSNGTAKYNCTVSVGGTTLHAIITIEFVSAGS